jgi:hypothetical protein
MNADARRVDEITEKIIGCAYLRATGLKVCLLMNFGAPRVELKRLVHGF